MSIFGLLDSELLFQPQAPPPGDADHFEFLDEFAAAQAAAAAPEQQDEQDWQEDEVLAE